MLRGMTTAHKSLSRINRAHQLDADAARKKVQNPTPSEVLTASSIMPRVCLGISGSAAALWGIIRCLGIRNLDCAAPGAEVPTGGVPGEPEDGARVADAGRLHEHPGRRHPEVAPRPRPGSALNQ